ncbi:MAG: ATP-binding cassette domain-containing protein [Gammaproteobacteria bacterium]
MAFIAPIGCGKPTLLRLIAGLIQPDSGTITFEGTGLSPDNTLQIRQ